jgi:predicted HTH transcriptional regulator
MNLIEGWSTGIPRLFREMEEHGLAEPEFIDMEIALRINLYRATDTTAQSGAEKVIKNVEVAYDDASGLRSNNEVHLKCA